MKKIIILLIVIFTLKVHSQGIIQDPKLAGFTRDFMNEGSKRGYNVSKILYARLISIEFANLSFPNLGAYTYYNKTIRISPYVLLDRTLIRLTIYHELGHVLKLGSAHSCDACSDIMSATQYKSICYYKDEENMKKELDKLFKWIFDERI